MPEDNDIVLIGRDGTEWYRAFPNETTTDRYPESWVRKCNGDLDAVRAPYDCSGPNARGG